MRRHLFVASIASVAMLGLAACSGSGSAASPSSTTTAANAPSEIEASVQKAVKALDDLGIQHTAPVRKEVNLSGAKASFDLTVNGHDAGILVFPSSEALASWEKMSDSFGGVNVAFDNAAISLNSHDGIANSVEIAPKLAQALGGQAHGV